MDMLGQTPLTKEDFVAFGIEDTAYVRPVIVNGRKIHVIHAADGTILTAVSDRDIAFITIRQYEMNPVSVH
ncbi:MAG: DUF1150 family protein [Proteobacteria bacterium]|nr:DUF1150 family protein [Alphaproteobacteria bacterium]NCC02607.1 DUF1150 family protein [Pseudomonadota bacterium]